MARPEKLSPKSPAPLTRSSSAAPTDTAPTNTGPTDAALPRTTAQQVRVPVMSSRPGPSHVVPTSSVAVTTAAVTTAAVEPAFSGRPVPESGCRLLASAFLCRAVGTGSGPTGAAATLYRYVQPPMDYEPVIMDSAWQEHVFGDGEVDGWLANIRERCAPIVSSGLAAYAHAVMNEVFPDTEGSASDFPATLYEIAVWIDHFGMCAALDSDLDLHSLEKLGSRLCVRFLCNTVLLPRLRVDPDVFPEPKPTAQAIAEQLAEAFKVHAAPFQQQLMRISDRQLGDERREKMHRLLRAEDMQGWLDENEAQIDWLDERREDFFKIASSCLAAPFSNLPLSFPLTCLLKVFQSYPQTLEQHVTQLRQQVNDADDQPPVPSDVKSLAQQQAELTVQRQLWMADLTIIRRELLTIARLEPAGKAYLHKQLTQLALAEYRPRIGAIHLRTVLRRASRQQSAITEVEEPDQ